MISKPKFKIGRRLGSGVYDKCQTTKFVVSSKVNTKRPKALSEYGTRFLEKQKVRFSYGISERQLSNYVKAASLVKGVHTADKFYENLESRLDNVIYRLGIAPSRRAARQMVSHGHFVVNTHKVTIPSYQVKSDDILKVRDGSKNKKIFENLNLKLKDYVTPAWLSFDINTMTGKMLAQPKNMESFFDLNAVLEFYSR